MVMVQVRSIAEMGAYVSLLEYGNIEGMILLSELSRRRIRSVQKLIKVGRQEPVMVLRVDKEKGYIDLSKRRVSPEDIAVRVYERLICYLSNRVASNLLILTPQPSTSSFLPAHRTEMRRKVCKIKVSTFHNAPCC